MYWLAFDPKYTNRCFKYLLCVGLCNVTKLSSLFAALFVVRHGVCRLPMHGSLVLLDTFYLIQALAWDSFEEQRLSSSGWLTGPMMTVSKI
jgi:hypothetical protein